MYSTHPSIYQKIHKQNEYIHIAYFMNHRAFIEIEIRTHEKRTTESFKNNWWLLKNKRSSHDSLWWIERAVAFENGLAYTSQPCN